MQNKTKIVVLHMKEVVYTAILIALAILFIVLLFVMFGRKESNSTVETMAEATYIPGIYTTSFVLNNQVVDVEVTVDENHINSVSLNNISEAVTTLFPLMEPSFDSIAAQIKEGIALSDLTYDQESYYTSQLLIQAIQSALDKASIADIQTNNH